MVAAIGSGGGNIGVSLAQKGHGHSNGQPHQGSTGSSGQNRPVGGSEPADRPTISDQAAVQSEFESTLRAIALQIASDAMDEAEDAMAETEEDA
ncbi:nodulation protein NopC [Mesorhizobium huakuii]|uniref:Nodulation protein NopC n=1 Tax=Mesorhizobium huakuii TaxID=28104 RepID=A0A7G6T5Y8_9HYPH|nr:nodulation protein NopC [Mesorhizobium huakuii]QND62170.1 nodulation protein NopC [Mesorhizobium huakuii]